MVFTIFTYNKMSFKIQSNIKTGIGDYFSTPIWNAGQIQGIDVSQFSGITDGQVMVYDQTLNKWVARDIVVPINPSVVANVRLVAYPSEDGQFPTITSAMNSITDASVLNPYVIRVGPGIYSEENITVKEYVSIVGYARDSVKVISNTGTNSVFNMGNNTSLNNITLESSSLGIVPLINVSDKNNVYISSINLNNAPQGLSVGPSNTGGKILTILDINSVNITDTVLTINGTGTGLIDVIINVLNITTITNTSSIKCFGNNATFNLFSGNINGNGTGMGVNVYNGARVFISGFYIKNFPIGISDVGGGTGPNIIISSTEFNNVTTYIQILNVLSTGYANGYIGLPNVSISASSNFFLTQGTNLVLNVEKKGGTFMSVASAIAYINTLSPPPSISQQYTVIVGSGNFIEPPFTIPQFVEIRGNDTQETILTTSSNTSNFITASINTSIKNMSIIGPTGLFSAIYFTGGLPVSATQGTLYIDNIQIRGSGYALINVNTTPGVVSSCSFRRIDLLSPFTYGVAITNSGILSGVLLDDINFNNNFSYVSPISVVRTDGINTIQLVCRNSIITDPLNTGMVRGIEINTGGSITVNGLFTSNLSSSLSINNSVLIPALRLYSSAFLTPNPNALVISNPNTLGSINVVASSTTMNIVTGATIDIFTQSPTTGTISLTGNIRQGATFPEITNISESIQKGSSIGILMGGIITNTGLNISVSNGTGYLMSSLGGLKYITWGILPVTLGANVNKYLYITEDILLQTADALPDTLTNIILGFVKTGASNVDFIQEISNQATHTSQLLDDVNRQAFGPIYSSGSIVSNGSSARSLNVTSGTYYYGTHKYSPSGASPVTIRGYYGTNSSVASFTQLATPFQYDNAGVLTNITGGNL